MTKFTKIDCNHNRIRNLSGLDDLARVLFPGNRNHQHIFLSSFVELKWAENQFLPSLEHLPAKWDFSKRSLETVRAKMRSLGLIDHVSRFNQRHGYREGWVFSKRFEKSLAVLSCFTALARNERESHQRAKDFDAYRYL